MKKKEEAKQLTPEEFVLRALETLRKPGAIWLHTVFSHFNEAFREYFPGLDPVKTVKELAEAGVIDFRYAKGGAAIAPAGTLKKSESVGSKSVLKKMGLV